VALNAAVVLFRSPYLPGVGNFPICVAYLDSNMDSEYLSGQPPPSQEIFTPYNQPSDVGTPVNDLLLPPPWTTTATDSATSFFSLVGFMQRRISDLVGATSSSDNRTDHVGFYDVEPPDQQIPQSYNPANELHRAG
jgi:hypothetical protein